MNQILSTASSQKKEKKRKEKNKTSGNRNFEPNIMKKAVIIFSILLIVFAIVIIGVKLIQIIKNNFQNSKIANLNQPQITIERVDENNLKLKIDYDEGITKLTWWWNNDISQIAERNYNVQDINIPIPSGESNTLHVEAIGADGSIAEKEEVITRDMTISIEWNQLPDSDNMEIIARAQNGIDKLVYYWNDEQVIVVPATEENQTELRTTIQLLRGTNTLHTIVTDSEGNTEEKTDLLHCVKEPVITVEANEDQMKILIIVSHDMGIKNVKFEINGREIIYDENNPKYDPEKTELRFTATLQPGIENTVNVTAYSNELIDENTNTSATYSGKTGIIGVQNTEENTNTDEE